MDEKLCAHAFTEKKIRLILGISGASGVELGYRFLQVLRVRRDVEIHLVITQGAKNTFACETAFSIQQIEELADFCYDDRNLAAKISSGSFKTDGMVVLPCSMKTLSNIVAGNAGNLLVRAADVCMKERRKLVLVPREMPLSTLHLRNMTTASELGCVVIPPVLTFYNGASTLDEQIHHIIGKILMQFDLDHDKFMPWDGLSSFEQA